MQWLCSAPKISGKSEEQLSTLCHVSQAAQEEFFQASNILIPKR